MERTRMMRRILMFIVLSKELFDQCDNHCKVGTLWWKFLFLTITNYFVVNEDDWGCWGRWGWRTWIGILCKNNNRATAPCNRQGSIWCDRLNWGFWLGRWNQFPCFLNKRLEYFSNEDLNISPIKTQGIMDQNLIGVTGLPFLVEDWPNTLQCRHFEPHTTWA